MPLIDPFDEKKPGLVDPIEEMKDVGLGFPQGGEIRQTPPWYIRAVEPVLEGAGMVAGTLAGAPGGLTTMGAGGAGGFAAGKGLARRVYDVTGYGPSKRPSLLQEGMLTLNDLKEGAEYQMAGDIGGVVVTKGAQKLLAPSAKAITEEVFRVAPRGAAKGTGEAANEAVRQVMRKYGMQESESILKPEIRELYGIWDRTGYKPLPSEVFPSKTRSILEGVLNYEIAAGDLLLNKSIKTMEHMNAKMNWLKTEGAPAKDVYAIGKELRKEAEGILSKYTNAKGEKLNSLVDDFMMQLGGHNYSRFETGKTFGDIMALDRNKRMDEIRGLYKEVREALPAKGQDVVLATDELTGTAQRLLDEELAKSPGLQNHKVIKFLRNYVPKDVELPEGITAKMLEKDPELKAMIEADTMPSHTWMGMDKDRSELLARSRAIHKSLGEGNPESGAYDTMAKEIDNAMVAHAEKIGGDAATKIKAARDKTWQMHDLYDKDLLKIMQRSPEDILDRIVNKGEVTLLQQIKEAVGEKGLEPLRRGFFTKTINSSMKNGSLDPVKLQKLLTQGGMDETMAQLATPRQLEMLNNIVRKGITFKDRMGSMKTVDFLETLGSADIKDAGSWVMKDVGTVKMAKTLLSEKSLADIEEVAKNNVFKIGGRGDIMPISTANAFRKMEPQLKELMTPDRFAELSDFVKMAQHSKRIEELAKNASQTGQTIIGHGLLRQSIGAVGSAAMGIASPALKIIGELSAGRLMAKFWVSDAARKYFMSAMKLPPNSPEAIGNLIKAATIVGTSEGPQQGQQQSDPTIDSIMRSMGAE